MSGADAETVVIGRVLKAHGIRGELKVRLFDQGPDLIEQLDVVLLRQEDGGVRTFELVAARATPRGWILRLGGMRDRGEAEALAKSELIVRRDRLPELLDDEFYYHDLEGLAVLDTERRPLGQVVEVFDNGANEVLVVRHGEREVLLPFIDEIVVEVDLEAQELILDPLEGLLDQ